MHQGICQKCNEVCPVIVISVVAEQVDEALPFFIQFSDIEMIPRLDDTLFVSCLYHAVCTRTESLIADGVQIIRLPHIDMIGQLDSPRILGTVYLIRDIAVEIAVIMQQVAGNFHPSVRINSRQQDRFGCQFLEDPFPESFFITFETVVYP